MKEGDKVVMFNCAETKLKKKRYYRIFILFLV